MRSKVLVIITAILVFGIGFAVYAYNSTSVTADTAAASCCCCGGDSCPMKSPDGKAMAKTEGGHSCSCCAAHAAKPTAEGKTEAAHSCCGDSCPMKAGHKMEGMADHKMEPGMKHDMKMANGESCPMMKDGKMAEMHKSMMSGDAKAAEMHKGMDGKAAGCSCACCNHSAEKKVTGAI